MTNADAQRCRHERKGPDGRLVQCDAPGGWVRDDDHKTWRPAKPGERKRRCWLHGPATVTKPIGHGRRRNDKPNERMQRYAALVLGLAPEVTKALRDVDDELSLLGFPSSGGGSTPGTGDDDGPVARDAVRITELTAWREDLRDWIGDLEGRISFGMHIIRQIRRLPPAAMGAKLCAENQQGRQGSIEWGDATCTELPTKKGLCAGCYHRERRWRTDNDIPTDEHPAA